ncbi:MAG: hypothetical protein PHI42_03975 [Paludibacteraceae bacterium]|nr:hypothetical protein [Paludibacteraceae bacterium]
MPNYLLAEIKKRGNGEKTFKVFDSNNEIYSLPTDLDHPKAYDSNYKLEDDEWFHIPNFSTTNYCIDILTKPFISTEYNQISGTQLEKINYLIAHQQISNDTYFLFQKINTAQIVKKHWFEISDAPALETKTIVIVNDIADAIYSKNNDILYFKRLTSLTSIFNGISELYRVATQAETENFLNEDFINLEDDFSTENVGTANRKRIAMAVDTFKSFTIPEKKVIFDYIKDYCSDIPFDNTTKKFSVKDEEGLKHLLWGIEQRYYTTKVGGEKRVANSVSKVG